MSLNKNFLQFPKIKLINFLGLKNIGIQSQVDLIRSSSPAKSHRFTFSCHSTKFPPTQKDIKAKIVFQNSGQNQIRSNRKAKSTTEDRPEVPTEVVVRGIKGQDLPLKSKTTKAALRIFSLQIHEFIKHEFHKIIFSLLNFLILLTTNQDSSFDENLSSVFTVRRRQN